MICDSNTGDLIDKATEIMPLIPKSDIERFSYELIHSEIESNTKICDNVIEASQEVIKYRNLLKDIGLKINYNIGINGTHPTAKPAEQKFIENDSYSWVKDQLNYYASRNITFSTHVHIGVESAEKAVLITNSARRWIAPLLALSVNSPFFEGYLTGMKSSRTFQFSTFPRTNIPTYIKNIHEYHSIIDKYIKTKSIEKPRQIWWKIRPHIDYGTVEFRMCDAQRSIRNVSTLAAIMQAIVHKINIDEDYNNSKYNEEYLNDSLWKASRYGLDCTIVDPHNDKIVHMNDMVNIMMDYIKNSLIYFGNENVINNVNSILSEGTECDKQLTFYKNNENNINELKKYLIKNVDYHL